METLYTAIATATGGGRDGHVSSESGRIDMDTRPPAELGGNGQGTNPEELFASGYSACFLSAMHAIARSEKIDTTDAAVSASVHIGPNGQGGFQLAVELDVYAPKLSRDEALALAEKAHQVCPYSNATRGNIEVTLSVVE